MGIDGRRTGALWLRAPRDCPGAFLFSAGAGPAQQAPSASPRAFPGSAMGQPAFVGNYFAVECPRVVASAMHTIYVVARISASKCYQCHVAIKPDDIVVTFDSGASIHVRCWPVNTRNLSPLRRRSPRAMRRSRAGTPPADQATLRDSVDVLSQRLPAEALRC